MPVQHATAAAGARATCTTTAATSTANAPSASDDPAYANATSHPPDSLHVLEANVVGQQCARCESHFIVVPILLCPENEHFPSIDFPQKTNLQYFASLQTNQLTDIICRAVQPSIQSATNTLTRNSSLHDTGDYAIPQPHPHHHIVTTTKSTTSLIRCGSCPGSTGVSRRGSSSESSPAGTVGHASIHGGSMHGGSMHGGSMHGGSMHGGSDGASVIHSGYYTDTAHYDRMPIPIPIVPAPPHLGSMHSEDEIEPAYATVFPNPTVNIPPPQQQMNYQVEDRSIYRRGARRWRKLYRINGHIFQAKRFNRVS